MRARRESERLRIQRESALRQVEDLLEFPVNVLAFLWLILTVIDLTRGLSPFLENVNLVIWGVFWVDFVLKFVLAPDKTDYVRRNVLTLLALVLPALRIFRALRALRFARLFRGGQVVRIVAAFNRGLRALRRSLRHRGFGYVAVLTLIVNVLGAAGIYALERGDGYVQDFGTALWWAAMMITTMGTDYFPRSSEGRFLSLLLATYGFAVFGYVTAAVAGFFVGREAAAGAAGGADGESSLREVNEKLDEIRRELRRLGGKS